MITLRTRGIFGKIATAYLVLVGCAFAQQQQKAPTPRPTAGRMPGAIQPPPGEHRFLDRTNFELFAGVAAVRALDFTSTEHFRERGHNEILLTNSIVDNKPLFGGIEAAGLAASIAASYLLHRTGHHKLERWVSVIHIGVAGFGDVRNYTLSGNAGSPPAP